MVISANKIKSIFLVFFIAVTIYLFAFRPQQYVFADTAQYNISYNISYVINPDGTTRVDYFITLRNLTDTVYAASQSLTTTQTDMTNIQVYDSAGSKQDYSVSKKTDTTTITTNFANPAIGSGSSDSWHITYQTKQIAALVGHAWNIIVPGFSNLEALNITDLKISISVPQNFGQINYSSPVPATTATTRERTMYTFNRDQINASGISMTLGARETYSFSFNYPIKTSTTGNTTYTIVVPPDTATQQIAFTKISPKPSSFTINKDGDYILTYSQSDAAPSALHVSGIATVESTYNLLGKKLITPQNLSAAQMAAYTKQDTYWETNNTTVSSLATQLTQGQTANIDKARSIYNYIVSHFKYNKAALYDSKRTRKGALYAINHPDDVICQEYVDAFVALARSAGIPAVFDAGYGNTLSPLNTLPPNVLHAWAEFYDPNYGWIAVDPTWASTSGLDYFGNIGSSHFLIAKYGYSSTSPQLVLSFTEEKNPQENIQLEPTSDMYTGTAQATVTNNIYANSGISTSTSVETTNTGNRVLYENRPALKFNNTTYPLAARSSDSYVFPTMSATLVFKVTTGNLLTNQIYQAVLVNPYRTFDMQPLEKGPLQTSMHITSPWFIMLIPLVAIILIFVISYGLVNVTIKGYHRFAKK